MKILSPSISLVAFERRGELLKIFLNWHYCLIPLLINHGQLLYWRTFAARTISEYYLSGSGPTWSLSSWRIIPWDKSLWLPRGFASLRVYSSVFIRGKIKGERRGFPSVFQYTRGKPSHWDALFFSHSHMAVVDLVQLGDLRHSPRGQPEFRFWLCHFGVVWAWGNWVTFLGLRPLLCLAMPNNTLLGIHVASVWCPTSHSNVCRNLGCQSWRGT